MASHPVAHGVVALVLIFAISHSAIAQIPRGGPGRGANPTDPEPLSPLTSPCPACEKEVKPPPGKPDSFTCPHCQAKILVAYNPDGFTLTVNEKNKFQTWLVYGGIALGVIGVGALILKNTLLAPAKPKKKKRRREELEDDDADDDDDRPRKRKRDDDE